MGNQQPRYGAKDHQFNTRVTADYTMKHKPNTSQKLGCYFKSQLLVTTESQSQSQRLTFPWGESQINVGVQKWRTLITTVCRLER